MELSCNRNIELHSPLQYKPFLLNPVSHEHVKDPSVLVQLVQFLSLLPHSLISEISNKIELLSNSYKIRGNTTKDEKKFQPIFLPVSSGSCVTISRVY